MRSNSLSGNAGCFNCSLEKTVCRQNRWRSQYSTYRDENIFPDGALNNAANLNAPIIKFSFPVFNCLHVYHIRFRFDI